MAIYKNQDIYLHNSTSSKKELFKPIKAPNVGMYVCGPTVYSDVHLGNCRTFLSFDILFRYLTHLGYKVRYVRNITDAGHLENDADEGEDKISKKARIEQLEPMEIVQRYTTGFHQVMNQFNAMPPSIEPTATGHIIEQIEMIEKILKAGYAYESEGSVYFDVEKYNAEDGDYGMLSKRVLEDLQSGSRELDGQSEKKSPLDFALWKKASPSHIMRWPSPWSIGFPGWHLECSVMSTKYLGEQFDIHGGGMDLKFPHHECEIAQNKACNGHHGVNYWLHANMLTLNGKRMSKSTGNTLLPHELFSGDTPLLTKGFDPSVVKFFMLQAHYRSVLDFSNDALLASEKGFHKLMDAYTTLENLSTGKTSTWNVQQWTDKVYGAMNDDMNTPIAIAHLFDAVKVIHAIKSGAETLTEVDTKALLKVFSDFLFNVFGLLSPGSEGKADGLDTAMEVIIELRNAARADKDWALSDRIRDSLQAHGIQLKDGAEGTTYTIQ